ncbi:hypothetical protein IKB17_06995 [bacterium]|nr:hypothetical protein [bacterium]
MKITRILSQDNRSFQQKFKVKKPDPKTIKLLEEVTLATTGIGLAALSTHAASANNGSLLAPSAAISAGYSSTVGIGGSTAAVLDSTKLNDEKKEKIMNKSFSVVAPLGLASSGGAISVADPNDYALLSTGLTSTAVGLTSGAIYKSNLDKNKSKQNKDIPS